MNKRSRDNCSPIEDVTEWSCGDYKISTSRSCFDADVFHAYVSQSYWARNRSRETNDVALANSLIFGAHTVGGEMVGAARVVTDYSTFGWISDVFVLEAYQGKGLGKALISAICEHPSLGGIKRMMLVTDDAHGLYELYGFRTVEFSERLMELLRST